MLETPPEPLDMQGLTARRKRNGIPGRLVSQRRSTAYSPPHPSRPKADHGQRVVHTRTVVNHVHHEANTITGAVVRNPAVRGVTGVAQFTTDGVRRGLRGARHLFHREGEGDSDGADSHYDALLDGHPLRDEREREVEEEEEEHPTPPPYEEGEMRSPVSPLATAAEHLDPRG